LAESPISPYYYYCRMMSGVTDFEFVLFAIDDDSGDLLIKED